MNHCGTLEARVGDTQLIASPIPKRVLDILVTLIAKTGTSHTEIF